jgi:hypothetical protein
VFGSRTFSVLVALIATGVIATILAPSALAEISGPCTATINGQSVENQGTGAFSDPITVKNDAVVPVTMQTNAGDISHLTIKIEFAGTSWTVRDKPSHGNSWASTVNVKDYAKYGVGLYKVVGSSSGGVSCSGSALVKVEGNPLTTVAGIAGLVAAILGVAGIALAFVTSMHAGAMGIGRSLLGLLAGLIAGLGLAVLFQEFALVYPTLPAAIIEVGLGGLIGLGLTFLGKLLGSGAAAAA